MEFIHGFMDLNFSWESTDPQAGRPLSGGQECQLVSEQSPGLCKEFSGGLRKGFFSVAESLEKCGRGRQSRDFQRCWWGVLLLSRQTFLLTPGPSSAQRIFVNVPSSQHFPVIGTVKRIRWRPQNRCLLLPKHCKKHPS